MRNLCSASESSVFLRASDRRAMRFALFVAGAALTAMSASPTSAQGRFAAGGLSPDCFSLSAVAMTPYDVNIQANHYRMTHERVYHNTTATGSILLYGQVHPWRFGGDGVSFSVTYKDPDGQATGGGVRAQLRHIGSGGIRIIATLDSNERAAATTDAQVMSVPIPWSQVNQRTGHYVVRIYVERSTVAVAPAAFGYSLCSAVF
jgi:hypothetical protein